MLAGITPFFLLLRPRAGFAPAAISPGGVSFLAACILLKRE